jgi:hypothetical protein
MGEVWRARDGRVLRDVALKVVHGTVGDAEARRRLLAESRTVIEKFDEPLTSPNGAAG